MESSIEDEKTTHVDNDYFLLDLKLPKFKKATIPCQHPHGFETPKEGGFVEMLGKIFGPDIQTNNRWLNHNACGTDKKRYSKKVRFSISELESKLLPYCRRSCPTTKPGQLHATDCYNSTQESVEVIGANAWQCRVFILGCQKFGTAKHELCFQDNYSTADK